MIELKTSNSAVALACFRKIAGPLDVSPVLDEVSKNTELWQLNQRRQQTIAVQAETNSIFLRSGTVPPASKMPLEDAQDTVATRNWSRFPATAALLLEIAQEEKGSLQRAMLAQLKPKGKVYRHIDHGSYYARRDRYHLVLQSRLGSSMKCGNEEVVFHAGELWCFNNRLPHEAENPSDEWRIHLIFDLLPEGRALHFS
jgi:aspartyl/asparaginyl beta-hydroxylase (cupin superfamily)